MAGSATRCRAVAATTLVVLAASLLATAPAQAAPGDLDPIFSEDGRQVTDFGGWDKGRAVAMQADGKLVVAGRAGDNFALARYNPDGSLDASFSGDGKTTTDFGGFDGGHDLAVDPDGKIVVAGAAPPPFPPDSDTPPHDFALARYNPDGSLDTSFSEDGMQTTDFGGSHDEGRAVALQSDGRIVVTGLAGEQPPDPFEGYVADDFALARYNPDGSLDASFSEDGKQTTGFSEASTDRGEDLAIQPGGEIVVVGEAGGQFALARYHPDGALDASFSEDGKQATDFGAYDSAYGVALQPDGRIVAVGAADHIALSIDTALVRYNEDGSLDASFSGDGKVEFDFAGDFRDDHAAGVAIQADARIVTAGGTGGQFALARYGSDGTLDTEFSGDGKQTTDFAGHDIAEDLVLQPDDGKIVAAGSGATSDSGDIALARYQGGSGGAAPTNSSPPTTSGAATEGQTLTVNPGTWSGSAPVNTYRWRRCDSAGANCIDIAAATATSYALTAVDVGHTLRVRETATNAYGQSSVDSAPTAVVKPKPGAITGSVRNASRSIAGAGVDCGDGYSAKTASGGTYSIPNVAPARYSCTASASGYRASTQTVTVISGRTTTANFKLRR